MIREHAKIVDLGGYGQGLVYLDRDDNGVLYTRYRVMIPDGSFVDWSIKLPDGVSEEGINIWEEMQKDILDNITSERFIEASKIMGLFDGED